MDPKFKANISNSLENIDPKRTIKFFDEEREYAESFAISYKLGRDNIIWTIEDYLTEEECDILIGMCEYNGFDSIDHIYDTEYRDSERILAFDENGCLVKTLENRLNNDLFIKRLTTSRWKEPFGFNLKNYKWGKNTNNINPCLRFNKYSNNSNGFGWHRDAQYTQNEDIRSNYTMVVYLTNNSDGATHFISPKNSFVNRGYTVHQEMNILEQIGFDTIKINPKKGMVIIFDQRLLHKADPCANPKYILRTDLLCRGIPYPTPQKDKKNIFSIEKKLETLTRQLFRQAQYYELESKPEYISKAQELYEICLSLRQNPQEIKDYPEHLEKLLVDIPIEEQFYSVKLVSRSGHKYVFKYHDIRSIDEIINTIKIAAAFTILSSVRSIDSSLIEDIDPFMQKLLQNIGIPANVNIDFNDNEGYEDEYYNKKYDTDDLLRHCIENYHSKKYPFVEWGAYQNKIKQDFVGLVMSADHELLKTLCVGCPLCDSSCNKYTFDDFKNEKMSLKVDNFEMEINPTKVGKNIMMGQINLIVPKKSFNHASCNCETYATTVKTDEVYWMVELKMNFLVDIKKSKILIKHKPKVVV